MAYTDIDKPNNYFNTMLYTANGAVRNITEADTFQADLVWLKRRNAAVSHHLVDSVRGATKAMYSNTTGAEATDSAGVTGFVTDGFSLGGQGGYNDTGTFVSWTWKKQAGVFDIQTYTGNGSNRTISHNLGVVPKMMIIKKRNTTAPWSVGHASLGANQVLELDVTDAVATDNSYWNNTRPTSSVFSVGTDGNQNTDGHTYVIYLFGNKQGVSKMGSYTGNGNADGPMIVTGMKPAWVMVKKTSGTGNWMIIDNKRSASGGFNVLGERLKANANDAGSTADYQDHLSNGFKIRTTASSWNDSGGTYIYMAFAENPFVTSTGVPATAR